MTTTKSPPPIPNGMAETAPKRKKISTHWLYVAVIVAVVAGIAVGLIFGKDAAGLAVIGTAFVNLIKMMIGPIIFCTIVLGIGSVRKASQVGKVGGYALLYFIIMSTFALFLGLWWVISFIQVRGYRPLRPAPPIPLQRPNHPGTSSSTSSQQHCSRR